jgi:hypothetical protein
MLIKIGYDVALRFPISTPVIYLLRVHPSRRSDLEAVIRDTGTADVYAPSATQMDISEIPSAALEFLLPSRYCEVDSEFMDFAWRTFLQARLGRERVQAILRFCPWTSSV